MSKIFTRLYIWFRSHKTVFWITLIISVLSMCIMASRIEFEENVTSFFPSSKNSSHLADVYSHLKVSDKIVVMFTPEHEDDNLLSEASERLGELFSDSEDKSLIDNYMCEVGQADISEMMNFILGHLPCLMDDSDFRLLEELDRPSAVDSAIMNDYVNLISPAGFAMKDYILADPLAIGSSVLGRTAELNPVSEYKVRSGHVFTPDGRTMLTFIEPAFPSGETAHNDDLVDLIEASLHTLSEEFPSISLHYFGGPVMSVYNARQIKRDTYSTSIVALIIIVLFILAVFKRKRSVFLILCPVLYGALFALALSWLIQGSISGIAVGAGAAIMGVALSYSIHLLAHQNHVHTIEQLLDELCSPMIIGSVTTIGAFAGLLFTSSKLLQDFGLFASLTLLGTMIFCLVFLPQFLTAQADLREGRILRGIEKFSSYPFHKNKWLVGALIILTVVCTYMSTKVGFDSDMMDLTYWEPKLKEAETILSGKTGVNADAGVAEGAGKPVAEESESGEKSLSGVAEGVQVNEKSVMFVSVGKTAEEVFAAQKKTLARLDSLKAKGLILSYSDGGSFVRSQEEQQANLAKWQAWWTEDRVARLKSEVAEAAVKYGFREDSFDAALTSLVNNCETIDYFSGESMPEAVSAWLGNSDDLKMLITRVNLDERLIDQVYGTFSDRADLVIFDQAYFANQAAKSINDDFYLILFISSCLIFFVLWLSYGRLELALLSFLPMAVGWLIITGIMGILVVQFNIVNIILSTFIFGMGDDFSIFILEGLLHKYKTGRELLNSHKTAIFFSSFTMIVGIGALIFAKHPALHSIALITILGMVAVVLISYTAEPLIFNAFVTRPTSQGRPPYTFGMIVRNLAFYVPTVLGCFIILVLTLLLLCLPIRRRHKQALVSKMLHVGCKVLVAVTPVIKSLRIDRKLVDSEEKDGSDVKANNARQSGASCSTVEPGIIVANHQSSLDIILLMAAFPKVKFFVADWVKNSPLFGPIAEYLGYYVRSEGYEGSLTNLKKDIEQGWSLVIFPEGTRTTDGTISRFHKGAFYLASQVNAPVTPVVFYGNWRIMPKNHCFTITRGLSVMQVLEPVKTENIDYHDLAKRVATLVKDSYAKLCDRYDGPENPYFAATLASAYIYKGPVTEWYVRVKMKMEKNYAFFDSMLPDTGQITDIGCGMGQMDFMLSMYKPGRRILGIDYDDEKITVAQHCWLNKCLGGLSFRCDDASKAELPESDAFIISDMMHYLSAEKQLELIQRCASKLKSGGLILVRDSDSENAEGQKITALSEVFSTKILRFNRTEGELNYISQSRMEEIARKTGLSMKVKANDEITSNTFYILRLE